MEARNCRSDRRETGTQKGQIGKTENRIEYQIQKSVNIFCEERKPNAKIRKIRKPQLTPKSWIMARIYILFNPFSRKKNDSFKFRIILASKPDANSTCAESAKFEWHEILPHLFTNNAFVFKPFNESPRHLNQNRSSSFFKLAGSLPASEEPGISSSVKALAAITWRSKQTGKNHAEDWLASLPRY